MVFAGILLGNLGDLLSLATSQCREASLYVYPVLRRRRDQRLQHERWSRWSGRRSGADRRWLADRPVGDRADLLRWDRDALSVLVMVVAGFLCFICAILAARASVFMGDAGSTIARFCPGWFLVHLSQNRET